MPRQNAIEGRARVVKNLNLGPRVSFLTLEAPWVAEQARPGQFVMVGPAPAQTTARDPLLLRPLAVAGRKETRIDLLMGVLGRGTRLLAEAAPGTELTLRGPLGTGFPEPGQDSLLLIAGGLGAAPLLFAHRYYRNRLKTGPDFILGIPDITFQPLVDLLSGLVPGLQIFSEDGCLGTQGDVCTGLPSEPGEVWACGPIPMFRALLDRLGPDLPFRASLEARMGCGYGGCMGCTVPTLKGNLRCCCEGPVFDAREVLWHEFD